MSFHRSTSNIRGSRGGAAIQEDIAEEPTEVWILPSGDGPTHTIHWDRRQKRMLMEGEEKVEELKGPPLPKKDDEDSEMEQIIGEKVEKPGDEPGGKEEKDRDKPDKTKLTKEPSHRPSMAPTHPPSMPPTFPPSIVPTYQPSMAPSAPHVLKSLSLPPTFTAFVNGATNTEAFPLQDGDPSSPVSGKTISVAASGLGLAFLVVFFLGRQRRKKRTVRKKQGKGSNFVTDAISSISDDGDFAGVYKLEENENLNAFLESLGISWALRSAASRARPIQYVTHEDDTIIMKFKGVPRAKYELGGPATENILRDRIFSCTAKYTEDNNGFEVQNVGTDDGDYDLHIRWYLLEDTETVKLGITALFKDETKDPVTCLQTYRRIGEF